MRYFVALLLSLSTLDSTAQVKFGFSGGGTASTFDLQEEIDSPEYGSENKLGGTGGIKVDIPIGKGTSAFRIVPELFINQNGTKDEFYLE